MEFTLNISQVMKGPLHLQAVVDHVPGQHRGCGGPISCSIIGASRNLRPAAQVSFAEDPYSQ